MAVLEAWSYGLPVLMTAECNLPEGFAKAAALRCEPRVDSISAGITNLLMNMDGDARRAMGVRGRDLVELRFTWPSVARDLAHVYGWILGGPPPDCLRLGECRPGTMRTE